MTDQAPILVETFDGVCQLTLNTPEKYNALTSKTAKEIIKVTKTVARDASLRCLLVTGAGKGFCAGQDLAEVEDRTDNFSFRTHLETSYNRMVMALRTLEKPVVMAVNGACAGAGLGLALAGDIRYASDRAKFLTAFIGIGLVPDSGVSYWLPRLIGPARAAEMLFTNQKVDATTAADMGMINKVVPHDQLMEISRALAIKLASSPTKGIGLTKRALNRSLGVNLTEQLDYEAYLQDVAGNSADYNEGVTAFLEKRKPQFTGS